MRNLKLFFGPGAILGKKFTASAALATVLALSLGPIDAQATAPSGPTPGDHACGTGGSYTISYENGDIVATDLDHDCAGAAVIPSGVTKLGQFQYNNVLTSISIPASVTEIEAFAFANCGSLATVSIAANTGLTWLPDFVFTNTALTQFTIPANISSIRSGAFSGAPLTSLTFEPNSQLLAIGAEAFRSARFTSLLLPAGVESIGNYAFMYSSITSIQIPASVQTIGENAFYYSQLASVSFAPGSSLRQLSGGALRAGGVTALTLPETSTRTGYTFLGWSNTQDGEPFVNSAAAAAAVIDGQELYALWRGVATVSAGSEPNSQVVSIPVGLTAAEIPASSNLPKVSLAFSATTSSASATVLPIANPASAASTPFAVTGATKIVDIQVSGITGPVTVCLDGASTDEVFHYTGGAWVTLSQRTFSNGQVCGVTESFSPFTAAAPVPIVQNVPYSGPKITGRLNKIAPTAGGSDFTITGDRLSQVTSVNLEGKPLTIVAKSDSQIVVKTPAHAVGFVDLLLKSDTVSLTFQDAFAYQSPVEIRVPVISAKTFIVANPATGKLSVKQRSELASFVDSANSGSVLTCGAAYSSRAEAKAAKAAATSACALAKQANPLIATQVSAPALVKRKTAVKVLLSLKN